MPGSNDMSHETPSPLKPAVADDEDAAAQAEFKPLSAEEARQWREQHPALSPWRIVAWQAVAGSLAAGLAWLVSGRETLAGSVLYGALAVVLPASVLARAMSRQSGAAGAALAVFCVGTGQDSFDRGDASGCAQGGSPAELAGYAGGLCGGDEGVLGGHVAAPGAPQVDSQEFELKYW